MLGDLEFTQRILDLLHIPVIIIDRRYKILYQNKTSKDLFGVKIGGQCWREFWKGETLPDELKKLYKKGIITDDMRCAFCRLEESLNSEEPINVEVCIRDKHYESWLIPISEDLCLHYFVDITRQKASERELRMVQESLKNSLEYFETLFKRNPAMMLIVDEDRTILDVNPAFMKVSGYSKEDVVGKNASIIHVNEQYYEDFAKVFEIVSQSEDELKTVEYCFKGKDGSMIWAEVTGSMVTLPDNRKGVLWSAIDTTEVHKLRENLKKQALHDALTGLYNRYALEEELERAMERARRNKTTLAVCFIDLDDFKPINDNLGHDKGDEVLRVVSDRLKKSLRKSDFVARWGGDEFVILLENIKGLEDLKRIFAKIEEQIKQPIVLSNGEKVKVGLSMGVYVYKDEKIGTDEILYKADMAMYQAKGKKKSRGKYYEIYLPNPLVLSG